MANLERLTKRVKSIEKWIEENEETGGPQGILETMALLVNETRNNAGHAQKMSNQFTQFRDLVFEFLQQKEMTEDWDKFLGEKEDAVQEQETESVPVRDEPEASEGVREEDAEEQKTTE